MNRVSKIGFFVVALGLGTGGCFARSAETASAGDSETYEASLDRAPEDSNGAVVAEHSLELQSGSGSLGQQSQSPHPEPWQDRMGPHPEPWSGDKTGTSSPPSTSAPDPDPNHKP